MKWVYTFEEGNKNMRPLLGGKGANLAEMVQHELPVPPGFIVTTEACNAYLEGGRELPSTIWQQVKNTIHQLEKHTGKSFGDPKNSLIVSVRSGAPDSMPGMLETILNVGFTSNVAENLAQTTQNTHFAYESYTRLISKFGQIVYNIELDETSDNLHSLTSVEKLLKSIRNKSGISFPQDPYVQLKQAVMAVFDSWLSPKAVAYRQIHNLPDNMGTAAVVQAMVFGNLNTNSGTATIFTRDPNTGETKLFGEYLVQAQGEDLVAGIRTPKNIRDFKQDFPKLQGLLAEHGAQLERIYRDMQDIEFTIENGKLWLLQTRAGKRTPQAAVKVAVDMASEGLLSREEAILQVDPATISQLLLPRFAETSAEDASAQGIPSSPGAAAGRIAFSREQVKKLTASKNPVIFVGETTSPDDVPVMPVVSGILTQRGGATSHAAVVARGLNKPCVVGCEALQVDLKQNEVRIDDVVISQGEFVSIDGTTGLVYIGKKKLTSTDIEDFQELATLLQWADDVNKSKSVNGARQTQVWINANTPAEVSFARREKVKGIGLCKTEWMFHDMDFRPVFREALLAESELKRKEAMQQLQRLQARAFEAIFKQSDGMPVTVRLLAAPMDDFFPVRDAVVTELAELRQSVGWDEVVGQKEQLLRQINSLQQVNPRFGVRGVRYFLAMPALATMQVSALFEGVCEAIRQDSKLQPQLHILLPNVSSAAEISVVAKIIREIATSTMQQSGVSLSYQVGALIETPRAALTADEIAPLVDFLYLGTDGLTETVFGYGREDGNKFIPAYTSQNVLPGDPLTWFDGSGVGAMMQLAVQKAREAHPDIVVGICGAHTHKVDAVRFYGKLDLDYVVANVSYLLELRLALAQAKIVI